MSYLQQQKSGNNPAQDSADSELVNDPGDTATFGANDRTVDCYNCRSRILTDADRAEWWVTVAALLLIIGMGFLAI